MHDFTRFYHNSTVILRLETWLYHNSTRFVLKVRFGSYWYCRYDSMTTITILTTLHITQVHSSNKIEKESIWTHTHSMNSSVLFIALYIPCHLRILHNNITTRNDHKQAAACASSYINTRSTKTSIQEQPRHHFTLPDWKRYRRNKS